LDGKTIQEINLGDKAEFTKTILETDITFFCAISGDFNPMHVDQVHAESTRFRGRIAHFGVAGGLMAPILGMQLPGKGTITLEHWTRHYKPVYAGDTITCIGEVVKRDEEKNVVDIDFTWTNQKGQVVIIGGAKVMPPKK
jgi:3-hydroxybutyryl-CoA dehydratase